MIKNLSIFAFLVLIFSFNSCETDFSLNGDYKLTPVVFGLLDQNDSVHVVKITKAFLGDDDNLVYAKIPDSNYFAAVDAKIIEYEGKEKTGREWQLKDSTFTTKEKDGLFYSPEQKAYVFYEKNLDPKLSYELVADLNEGKLKIKAKTNLLDGFSMPNMFQPSSSSTIQFAKSVIVDEPEKDYLNWRFNVTAAKYSKRYEIGYTFAWTEHYTDGSSSNFTATKRVQTIDIENPENPGSFNAVVSGLDFYQWVEQTIPNDDNVDYRIPTGLSIYIDIASEELTQYLDVSKPVTGLAQVKPEYTNVENGYGLFSSRFKYVSRFIQLNSSSLKHLSTGKYTSAKKFCSPDPIHNGTAFDCP